MCKISFWEDIKLSKKSIGNCFDNRKNLFRFLFLLLGNSALFVCREASVELTQVSIDNSFDWGVIRAEKGMLFGINQLSGRLDPSLHQGDSLL